MSAPALLIRIALGAAFVAIGFPVYVALVGSLVPEARLFEGTPLVPAPLVLDHYRALFADREFLEPLRNSLIVSAATTLVCVGLGAPAAYALARLRFRGRTALLAGVMAVTAFPQISIVSPLYLLLRELGLINTHPGLVLPYAAFALPLVIWLLTGFFAQIPREIEQAAQVDGASLGRVLLEVVFPLAAPALAATSILTFVYCWNEFLFALSFTLGPERQTVPVAIALLRGQYQVSWGQVLAAAILASLPVALLVLAFQRRIVSGITSGAVKG